MIVNFKPFVHVERLSSNKIASHDYLNGENIYIFPKMDGTSGLIWSSDGKIHCGSRNRELSYDKDNANFYKYIIESDDNEIQKIKQFCIENEGLIVYGEFLGHTSTTTKFVGSIKTYVNGGFFVFAVFDTINKKYLSYDVYGKMLDGVYSKVLKPIAILHQPTESCVEGYVDECTYNLPNGTIGEGIVIYNYDYRDPWGHVQIAKIVRDEWHHDKSKKKTVYTGTDSLEKEFVEKYCTDAFVEKEVNKVLIALDMEKIDCKNGKFFGMAINKVLDELMEENFWDFFKKKKAASVKLAAIKGLTQARVREYILNN